MDNFIGGRNINHGIGMLVHFYSHLNLVGLPINLSFLIVKSWLLNQNPTPKILLVG
jgi:hypothetical protein